MYNQGYGGYNPYQQHQNGYTYGIPQSVNFTTGLTQEEINSLRQKVAFSMELTPEEVVESKCYHRSANEFHISRIGNTPNEDGSIRVKCRRCHQEFDLYNTEDLMTMAESAVLTTTNLLQNLKIIYYTLPDEMATYFTVIPLLKKYPHLLRVALGDFRKYGGGIDSVQNYNSDNNGFHLFNNIMNGTVMPTYAPQGMSQGMGQPTFTTPHQAMMQQPIPMTMQQQTPVYDPATGQFVIPTTYNMPQQGMPQGMGQQMMMSQQPMNMMATQQYPNPMGTQFTNQNPMAMNVPQQGMTTQQNLPFNLQQQQTMTPPVQPQPQHTKPEGVMVTDNLNV